MQPPDLDEADPIDQWLRHVLNWSDAIHVESLSPSARTKDDATGVSKIAVTTIDAVCASLGIDRITLLKIDVEGADLPCREAHDGC